ncbi:hypothetical protein E4T52_11451 [Aureobasidium sp. EXF-3400]|nr:hypothetical protein E4T52_11451 [Aureobasidium sp. EXF-3400]
MMSLDGTISYVELATKANMPEAKLKSVIRMAMTTKIFCQLTSGHIAYTACSALLATNQNHHNWAVFMSDVCAPIPGNMIDAQVAWA